MKEDKLIRGDAKLKKLPGDRQREIWEKINTAGETLKSVCAWLREDGIDVSKQTLSEWASFYALQLTFEETENDTNNFLELARTELPDIPEEKITRLGSLHFNMQAVKQRDPKLFLKMQTAQHRARMDVLKYEQRERELAQNERKLALLEAKEASTKKVLSDVTLTVEEQNQKLRAVFGMT